MIKFYEDEDGIKYGGVFLQGNKAMYASDEKEVRQTQRLIDNGMELNDFADWAVHRLDALQVATIKEEKTLYEL